MLLEVWNSGFWTNDLDRTLIKTITLPNFICDFQILESVFDPIVFVGNVFPRSWLFIVTDEIIEPVRQELLD